MIYSACHINDEFVQLTESEYSSAWKKGEEIYLSSQARNFRDKCLKEGGMRKQQLGEVAALAIAKCLNIEWTDSMDTFKGPDLFHNIEARLIGRDNWGLRVYDNDDDCRRVIGCIIEPGNEKGVYRIPGWINARHGKKKEWLNDPGNRGFPVYLVPQNRLHGLNSLRYLIQNKLLTT